MIRQQFELVLAMFLMGVVIMCAYDLLAVIKAAVRYSVVHTGILIRRFPYKKNTSQEPVKEKHGNYRMRQHPPLVIAALEDIVFWGTAAVVTFIIIYKINEGVIRSYALAGLAGGAMIFQWGIGNNVKRLFKYFEKN